MTERTVTVDETTVRKVNRCCSPTKLFAVCKTLPHSLPAIVFRRACVSSTEAEREVEANVDCALQHRLYMLCSGSGRGSNIGLHDLHPLPR